MLNPADFEAISRMVHEVSGITLVSGKEELVKARLSKRLRALGLPGYRQYVEFIEKDASRAELATMVELLTTNKTSFYRENQHFEFLRDRILPAMKGKRMRVWSAACSTGQEPYSIAMTLRDSIPEIDPYDIRILATDINLRVLEQAKEGVYGEEIVGDIPPQSFQRHFTCIEHKPPRRHRINENVRAMVRFAPLNLQDSWPMKGPFDLIFCRNVMIYFDKATQQKLISRFWELIRPGGYLFVGHSESLAGMDHEFQYMQPAVHLKPESGAR